MIEILKSKEFIIACVGAFFATIGASFVMIICQSISLYRQQQKKKLYCINYVSDAIKRLLVSNLILKHRTLKPHIYAITRSLTGEPEILSTMFMIDDIDIMKDDMPNIIQLPDEYKLLVGADNIEYLQTINLLITMMYDTHAKTDLNQFVKSHLISEVSFYNLSNEEQTDILKSYTDYIDRCIKYIDRLNGFIRNMVLPQTIDYINEWQFKLFSTKRIHNTISEIINLIDDNNALIHNINNMKNKLNDGIQKIL